MKDISQKKQKRKETLDEKIDLLWEEKLLYHCLDCGTRFYTTEFEALQNGEYCPKCR